MKLTYPDINKVFDTGNVFINTIIIENQDFFLKTVDELFRQANGDDGQAVLSKDEKIVAANKSLEVLTQFVPFEINKKSLLTKICSELETVILSENHYEKMMELLSLIENLLLEASSELDVDAEFPKISLNSIIKAAGPVIKNEYVSLAEKILDYFEIVRQFDGDKLFITVNLRCYISDDDAEKFIETALSHEYNIIMIEGFEHSLLKGENRFVIDTDLCEIQR